MAAATVKSENITLLEGSENLGLHRKTGRLKTVYDQRAIATTNVDDAGDLILLGPIPSNAVLIDVAVLNSDLDTACVPALTVDIGLAYSGIGGTQPKDGRTSGDAIDIDCFAAAATTLQGANTSWASVRFITDSIADIDKEAWEVAGLTEDPGGLFYLSINVETAAATDGSGTIVARIDYI